jgi:hypothetical protein
MKLYHVHCEREHCKAPGHFCEYGKIFSFLSTPILWLRGFKREKGRKKGRM